MIGDPRPARQPRPLTMAEREGLEKALSETTNEALRLALQSLGEAVIGERRETSNRTTSGRPAKAQPRTI